MTVETTNDGTIVVTGKQDIDMVRLLSLKAALSLEAKGMRASRRFSAYKILKAELGLTGSKASVLKQVEKIVAAKLAGK